MATEAGTPHPELNALFAQLTEPFDPSEIKWRVTHTTRDGSRGAVIAFADPRAYSDRLNQIFTPSGWTRTYEVNTVSSVTRMKRDKLIQTGKVLVTCTVTIAGLGTHADSGEEWADEENAMTSAQAQAFKRACTCFGLGRYLYNFAEMWVPLNQHRQPLHFPTLPQWALPKSGSIDGKSGARPPAVQRGPVDQKTTAKIEGFRRILGQSIYGEILWRIARARRANAIPNAQLQSDVSDTMERAARGIRNGRYRSWITRLRKLQQLSRIRVRATYSFIEEGNYDSPPLPSLLVAFKDRDAITACFDEEGQYMLEGTSEPAVGVAFHPQNSEEVRQALRIVERFVLFNHELFQLVEELQEWEKSENSHADTRLNRGEPSLRAA